MILLQFLALTKEKLVIYFRNPSSGGFIISKAMQKIKLPPNDRAPFKTTDIVVDEVGE